jgi:hypothetical protein
MDLAKVDPKQPKMIRRKYKRYKQERGAEIKNVFYITRDNHFHTCTLYKYNLKFENNTKENLLGLINYENLSRIL